ncbi:MAG: hypothetical protein R2881_02205 [Eubacteriales bacterium]
MIAAGLAALGFVLCPPFFEVEIGIHSIVNMILMMVGIVVYMILHEIIHGVFMKAFSGLQTFTVLLDFTPTRAATRSLTAGNISSSRLRPWSSLVSFLPC